MQHEVTEAARSIRPKGVLLEAAVPLFAVSDAERGLLLLEILSQLSVGCCQPYTQAMHSYPHDYHMASQPRARIGAEHAHTTGNALVNRSDLEATRPATCIQSPCFRWCLDFIGIPRSQPTMGLVPLCFVWIRTRCMQKKQ
jgi:hypothetical protein